MGQFYTDILRGLHGTFGYFYFVTQLFNKFVKLDDFKYTFSEREFHKEHIGNFVAFSPLCEFLLIFFSSMPNKAKNSTFYQIFQFLTLFGM